MDYYLYCTMWENRGYGRRKSRCCFTDPWVTRRSKEDNI